MLDQTGMLHSRANLRERDDVAFLIEARVDDTTYAEVAVARCGNVKRRRIVPMPSDWKARIAVAGLTSGITTVTRELQEHWKWSAASWVS